MYLSSGQKIPRRLSPLDLTILDKIISHDHSYVLHDIIFSNRRSQRIRKSHIDKGIVSMSPSTTHNIKIIDTINKSHPFPGIYFYYTHKDVHFNRPKIVVSKKGYLCPVIDRSKDFTYSDNFKLIFDDHLENVRFLIESNIMKYMISQFSKNGFDSIKCLQLLRRCELRQDITDMQELYEYYQLSPDEIHHIHVSLAR